MRGAVLADLDMAGWSREQTGFGFMRALRTDLMDVLLEEAKKQNIPVHFSKNTTEIVETDTEISVTFSDGTQASADLLLGCDGIHSTVRRLHINPGLTPEYTGVSNMFAILPTRTLSQQYRSVEPALHGLLTNKGLLGVMPCTASGDHLYWFYSREVPVPAGDDNRSGWEAHGKKEVEGLKDNLTRVLQGSQGPWTDQLLEMVQKTEAIKFYPIYRLPLSSSWFTKRCLVLGDAAHAMPPHAGQGTSMALEDVFLLSRLLEDPARPLADVLSKYTDIRRPRVEAIGRASVENGNVRKDVGPWALRMKECALGLGFWFYKAAGLQKWGIGMNQKDFAYDIMAEPI
jgi:2-polyprenyl-6-methoxyphenol hydroxylase-like FAD-dependent oxidoreductase